MSARRALRERLARSEILVVPGAFDALTGRLLERAGFEAIYRGGYAASAAAFGLPDLGITSSTEMVDHARRLCSAVGIPVIADADTGYGEVAQVIRTVHELERAGVAGIQLEDQVFPKRCGHMEGKDVIAPELHEQKLRAALAARADPDTLIVARTDAIAVTGLDDAIARAHRYADAGADVIFVDAPRSEDELRAIGAAGIGKPLLVNVSEYGRTPDLGAAAFEAARLLDRPVSDFDAVRGLAVDQGARRLAARDGHDARHRAAHDAVRRAQRDARQRRMGRGSVSANETVFTVAGTPLVFGPGCSLETGWHLRRAGVTRALVVTDPHLAAIGLIDPVVEAIRAAGVEAEVFAGSGVEPSEASVTQAIEAAREGGFDGFVGTRRRLVDRHRKDRRAALDAPGRDLRLPQPADRQGHARARTAAAAVRRAHHRRHRRGGDDGRDHRPARAPREDGDLARPPASRCSASSIPT